MRLNQITYPPLCRSQHLKALAFVVWVFTTTLMASGVAHSQIAGQQNSSPPKLLFYLASSGSAEAQYELGLLFEYGRGVDQDDATALIWYERSAAQLFPDALYRLAILYDNGWGPLPDKKRALDLYLTAAENGHSLAQHDLAILYFQGADAPKNLLQAYKWLKIAVIGGNPLMQKHLHMIAKEMSADEIEVAEYLAKEWVEHSGL